MSDFVTGDGAHLNYSDQGTGDPIVLLVRGSGSGGELAASRAWWPRDWPAELSDEFLR